jgi:ketosteroid isomerase-like protein
VEATRSDSDGLEVIKAVCEAIEAGDFARLAANVAPDGVFRGTVGGIDEGGVLNGPGEVFRYYCDVADTWDEWLVETEQVLPAGQSFVVFWRERTRSRELEMHTETATVFTLRDGKVVEARSYLDRAAALEAAGVR